ncbi:hypothetical protein [Nocardia yamanashiensis]|uniref:hypothetical protein n=1 Tax=Nocardia yamanashiensis TaxID=209247 RepID=UPI0008378DE4|nr:hypothetical protein [Nocardia yamanashiensis]
MTGSDKGDGVRRGVPAAWWKRVAWKFWVLQIFGVLGWVVFVAGVVTAIQNGGNLHAYQAESHRQIAAKVTGTVIRERLSRFSTYELTATAAEGTSRIEFPRDNPIVRRARSGTPVMLEQWRGSTVAVGAFDIRVQTTRSPAVALFLSLGYALGGAGFGLMGAALWWLERDRTRHAPRREAVCVALAFHAAALLAAALLLLRDPLQESWSTPWGLFAASAGCVAGIGLGLWHYHRSQQSPPRHGRHSAME